MWARLEDSLVANQTRLRVRSIIVAVSQPKAAIPRASSATVRVVAVAVRQSDPYTNTQTCTVRLILALTGVGQRGDTPL